MKKLFLLLTLMTLSLAAQTTSTELKTQIDTDITNKTGPGSISKVNVGNAIKSAVDYTVQEINSVKTATRGSVTATTGGADLIYDINEITSTASSQNLILPSSTNFPIGKEILIYKTGGYNTVYLNTSSGDFIVKDWNTYSNVTLNYNGIYRLKKTADNNWLIDRLTQEDEVRVFSDGTTIIGNGSSSDRIRLGYGRVLAKYYATGTSNPYRLVNYNTGQYLPTGVTKSFVRTGTGLYEVRIVGDATLPAMDCTGTAGRNIFLTIHNSTTLRYGGESYSDVSGIRTITYGFTNYVSGTLADGFNSGEVLDINFYVN